MATTTEVFRADLKVQVTGITGGKTGAVPQFKALTLAANQAVQALEGISQIKIRQVTGLEKFKAQVDELVNLKVGERGGISDSAERELRKLVAVFKDNFGDVKNITRQNIQDAEDILNLFPGSIQAVFRRLEGISTNAFEPVTDSARKVKRDVVDNSIVPDMIDEIAAEFKKLPRKVSPEYEALRREFNRLKADIRALDDGEPGAELSANLKRLKDNVTGLKTTQLENLAADVEKIEVAAKGSTSALDKNRTVLERLGLQSAETARKTLAIRDGLELAFRGKGIVNRITGVREAMVAMGGAGAKVASVLGQVENAFADTSTVQTRFGQQASRISEVMIAQTDALQAQAVRLRDMARSTGRSTTEITLLSQQTTVVNREFKRMFDIIESGGKVTPKQIQRIIAEVGELDRAFEFVEQTVGADMDATMRKTFNGMRSQVEGNEQAVRSLFARMSQLDDSIDEVGKSAGIFGKLKGLVRTALYGPIQQTNTALRGTPGLIKRVNTSLNATARAGSLLRTVFLGTFLGTALTRALFELEDAILRIPAAITSLASRAEESMSKFRIVFDGAANIVGGTADQMIEKLDLMSDITGRSALDLKEMAAKFQDTFVPLGFVREEAADLSLQLTSLVTDVASFNNVLDTKVAADFQTALVGNVEAVRKYGIIATQAALDAELLSMGIEGGIKNATEQQKVLARLSLIIKGTEDAQGDAIRTSESWANQSKRLSANIDDLGLQLGDVVLPALAPFLRIINQIAQAAIPVIVAKITEWSASLRSMATVAADTINDVLNGVVDLESRFSTFVALVVSLFTGDWGSAWQLFVLTIDDALVWAIETLDSFVDQAFDWGYNLIVEMTNGIIDAVNSVLVSAMNEIGSMIADFLAPGSPPKKGPLSEIDMWGSELVATFGQGFSKANTDFIIETLEPIAEALAETGEGGVETFKQIEGAVIELARQMNETGEFSDELIDKIADLLPEEAKGLAKSLKNQLSLQSDLAGVQQEILDAEAAGYIPAALKEKQAAIEGELAAEEERQDLIQKLARLEEQVAKGARSDEDKKIKAIAKAGAAAGKAAQKMKKTWQQAYDEDLANLNERYRLGAISEEEYLNELIRLEKKYVEDSIAAGVPFGLEEHVAAIEKAEARLADLKQAQKDAAQAAKDAAKEALKGQEIDFDVKDLFAPIEDAAEEAGQVSGINLSESLNKSIGDGFTQVENTITSRFNALMASVRIEIKARLDEVRTSVRTGLQKATEPVTTFFSGLTEKIKGWFTGLAISIPLLIALFSSRAGQAIAKASPAFSKVGSIISKLGEVILPRFHQAMSLVGRVVSFVAQQALPLLRGGLLSIGRALLPVIGRLTLWGAIAAAVYYGISSNIKLLASIFDDVAGRISDSIGRLIAVFLRMFGTATTGTQNLSGLAIVIGAVGRVLEYLLDVVQSVAPTIQELFAGIFRTVHGIALVTIIPMFDTIIGLLAIFAGDSETASASFLAAFDSIKQGIPEIINGIAEALSAALTSSISLSEEIIAGFLEMIGLNRLAQSIRTNLQNQDAAIRAAILSLRDIILAAATGQLTVQDLFEAFGMGQLATFLDQQLTDAFSRVSEAFAGLVSVLENQLLPIFVAVFNAAADGVRQAFDLIAERFAMLQPLWDYLIIQLDNLGISFDTDFSFIQTVVVAAVAVIVSTITGLVAVVVSVASGIAEALEVASTAFEHLSTGIALIIEGTIGVLTNLWDVVSKLFEGDFPGALRSLERASEESWKIVQGIWETAVGIFEGTIGTMLGFIEGFVDGAIEFFQSLSDDLVGNSIIPDMIDDILGYFLDLPNKIANALSAGAGIVSNAVSGLFGGLFGGDDAEEAAAGAVPSLSLDSLAFGTSATTIQTQFTTLEQTLTTGIAAVGAAWATLTTNMGAAWATLMASSDLAWQAYWLTLQTAWQTMRMTWQVLTTNMLTMWQTAMSRMTQILQIFLAVFRGAISTMISLLEELATAFEELGERAVETLKEIGEEADKAADKIKGKLIPAVLQAAKAFDKMAAAAKQAASASQAAGSTAPGGSGSFQRGTMFVPRAGRYDLHPGEVVIPPTIAPGFRAFVQGLNKFGIGGMAFNIGGGGANAGALAGAGQAGGGQTNIFELTQYISDTMDEALARERVLRWVADAIG